LLEAASLTTANPTDGLSLVSLLQGQSTEEFDRPLVWHFPNFWGPLQRPKPVKGPGMGPSSTIRYGDWKLIYYHTDQRFELFDLERDLGEKKNLATERPDVVNELAEMLTGYLQERDAVMPTVTSTKEKIPMPSQARL
jgi:arylsulfatase A-like enzyme